MASPLKKLLALADAQEKESLPTARAGFAEGVYSDERLKKAMQEMREALVGAASGDEETMRAKLRLFGELLAPRYRDGGKISPSEACDETRWCGRKFYLDIARFAPDVGLLPLADAKLLRLFDLGTMVHWYVQALLLRQGQLLRAEVRCYDPSISTDGSADGEVVVEVATATGPAQTTALLEIKTMNTFQFGRLTEPVAKQVQQASIYADILGLDWILMYYYDKNTSEVKTFLVPPDRAFIQRYRMMAEGLTKLYHENSRKRRTTDAAKHTALPPRACPSASCQRATECPYALRCFTELPTT